MAVLLIGPAVLGAGIHVVLLTVLLVEVVMVVGVLLGITLVGTVMLAATSVGTVMLVEGGVVVITVPMAAVEAPPSTCPPSS